MVTPEEARRIADAVDKAFLKVPAQALRDLASQVESLQADADRYRWLRDEAHPDNEKTGLSVQDQDWNSWGKPFNRFYSGKELDAKIDEARK